MKSLFLSILFFIFSFSINANEFDYSSIDGLVSLGLSHGGETLASGGDAELTTAGMMYFSVGGTYTFSNGNIQLQAAYGYNWDDIDDFEFSESSVEFIPFYVINDRTRIGAGVINLLSPKYSDPFGGYDYNDAIGTVFEIDWRVDRTGWLGIRYVDAELEYETIDGIDVSGLNLTADGSYFMLIMNGIF